jgi:serine/threonine-protein kinase
MTLLHLVGRALLETTTPQAVWLAWCEARNLTARREEWDLLRGEEDDVRRVIAQAVLDLTDDHRPRLAAELAEFVRSARRVELPEDDEGLAELMPPGFGPGPPPTLLLRVLSGPHEGKRFSLSGHDTFLVGRSRQAHFCLGPEDRYFSRLHFMIEVNPPAARVVDMGSHNGTYLNGRRVPGATPLTEGDRIQAGHTVLLVSMPGMLALQAPPSKSVTLPPRSTGVWTPKVPMAVPCRVCNPVAGALERPLCEACQAQAAGQEQFLPGFRVVRELGRGGMGVVCVALREAKGDVVAVKSIAPTLTGSTDQTERFLREARILQSLDHPNIVRFLEMGEANGLLYFAMEYVIGKDAWAVVQEQGPLSPRRAVDLMGQVLLGLEHAHERGFVHRDLKPANILITNRAGAEAALLADFGLARVYQESQLSGLTLTGTVGGTPTFMAPEQVTNYRDARPPVDQYSAAATLYALLTGRMTHDFGEGTQARLTKLMYEDPVPIHERRADVPGKLARVIHRALTRDPAGRFPSVGAFRKALVAAV